LALKVSLATRVDKEFLRKGGDRRVKERAYCRGRKGKEIPQNETSSSSYILRAVYGLYRGAGKKVLALRKRKRPMRKKRKPL